MLELDVLVGPFTEQHFKSLSTDDQQHYIRLIAAEDADLWAWLQGTLTPPDSDLQRMVDLINQKCGPGQVR